MAEEQAEEKKEAAPDATKADGGAKKKMIIIATVIVIDLLLMGGVAYFIVGRLKGEDPAAAEQSRLEEEAKSHEAEAHSVGHHLLKPLALTVNVGRPGEDHYLKCGIQLEWHVAEGLEEAVGGGHGGAAGLTDPLGIEIEHRMSRITDIIIGILSSQSYEELLSAAGKQKMKEAIVTELNAVLPEEKGRVHNAYFTEFLVQ
jgi:flagellar FliL protein